MRPKHLTQFDPAGRSLVLFVVSATVFCILNVVCDDNLAVTIHHFALILIALALEIRGGFLCENGSHADRSEYLIPCNNMSVLALWYLPDLIKYICPQNIQSTFNTRFSHDRSLLFSRWHQKASRNKKHTITETLQKDIKIAETLLRNLFLNALTNLNFLEHFIPAGISRFTDKNIFVSETLKQIPAKEQGNKLP